MLHPVRDVKLVGRKPLFELLPISLLLSFSRCLILRRLFPSTTLCFLLLLTSTSFSECLLLCQCTDLVALSRVSTASGCATMPYSATSDADSSVFLTSSIAAEVSTSIVSMTRSTSCPSSKEVTSLASHTATYHAQHQDMLISAFNSIVHGSVNSFLPCFIESNVVLSTPRSWESSASTSPCNEPPPGRAHHQLRRTTPRYSLTNQILELHRLDNNIKSTFGHELCSTLGNSLKPHQQEVSRAISPIRGISLDAHRGHQCAERTTHTSFRVETEIPCDKTTISKLRPSICKPTPTPSTTRMSFTLHGYRWSQHLDSIPRSSGQNRLFSYRNPYIRRARFITHVQLRQTSFVMISRQSFQPSESEHR